MGTVFRKTVTKEVPSGAEVFDREGERYARWKNARGKQKVARLTTGRNGSDRIIVESKTYTAKYRDGSGIVVERTTGCRDETAARRMLADWERRAELVKAKVVTAEEDAIADHQPIPLLEHLEIYIAHQTAKGLNQERINSTRQRIRQIASECGFGFLPDLKEESLERWLLNRQRKGMSAGSRNGYREAIMGFANWCVRTRRLIANPLRNVTKADNRADCRRKRRALTEHELLRLLEATRQRPLIEAMTIRKGKRKGELSANLRPEIVEQVKQVGQERALIYKTLVLTGLRLNELRTLTIGQLVLEGDCPCFTLDPADEKNRQGNTLPLRRDLARELTQWIEFQRERVYGRAAIVNNGQAQDVLPLTPPNSKLPDDTRLFTVPAGLLRILNRDLAMAGIPKRDERGRTVDLHAMRHTFGTLLSKGGVAPRTAQAAMRHSSIDLTMNTYTDPKLLDVQGALESLPELPLTPEHSTSSENERATGTYDLGRFQFAPKFAPTSDKSCPSESFPVNSPVDRSNENPHSKIDVTSSGDKRKDPLTSSVKGFHQVERKGVEPST
ncbi:MAG: site-specific integrase, partial [Planctomycetaceae bacterium]|nr:site-specific integrase [Planctomycetaceae bacterium]